MGGNQWSLPFLYKVIKFLGVSSQPYHYVKLPIIPCQLLSQAGTSPPVLCSPPSQRNEHVLKCDLGNPMAGNSKVNIL